MKEIFDARCPTWETNVFEHNLYFVHRTERLMNEKLITKGYVTIFDVYEHLGLPIDKNRLLKVLSPKDLCWWVDEGDALIDFAIKPDRNNNIIELNFNINIE